MSKLKITPDDATIILRWFDSGTQTWTPEDRERKLLDKIEALANDADGNYGE